MSNIPKLKVSHQHNCGNIIWGRKLLGSIEYLFLFQNSAAVCRKYRMKHDRVSMIQLCRLLVLSTVVQRFEMSCGKYFNFLNVKGLRNIFFCKINTLMSAKPKCVCTNWRCKDTNILVFSTFIIVKQSTSQASRQKISLD